MRISDWSSDVCASDLVELHRTLLDSEDRTLIVGVEIFGATRGNAGDVQLQVVREFDPAVRGNAARPFRRIGGAVTAQIGGSRASRVRPRPEGGRARTRLGFVLLVAPRNAGGNAAVRYDGLNCRDPHRPLPLALSCQEAS